MRKFQGTYVGGTWDGRPHTVIPALRQCGKSLVVLNAARAKAGLEPVEL